MGSKVLRNGTVISWDDELQELKILDKASILVVGDRIADIFQDMDETSVQSDVEVIDVTGKIITPGFINGHCHMWQTAFRSMAPDIFIAQYFGWLSQMGTATKSFSAEDVYLSCLEGYCEGLNGGVTSYVEHAASNWAKDVVLPSYKAADASGARVWWCHDLPAGNEEQLAILKNIKSAIGTAQGLVSMGLAPDAFDWSDDKAVQQMKHVIR